MKGWAIWTCSAVLLSSALVFSSEAQTSRIPALLAAPTPVYSADPKDSWNRIFYFLFSRRVEARLSNEFPEGAPFSREKLFPNLFPHLRYSQATLAREETGDRAIDPLYPSFLTTAGNSVVLDGAAYSDFTRAVEDALADREPRSALARALFQSDLWSAFDRLSISEFYLSKDQTLEQHRRALLDLLARLVRKVALTPAEIQSLPDNYLAAAARNSLPPIFPADSPWIEVRWRPRRAHDETADFRRVTRIFLKPSHPPSDMREFLDAFRDPQQARLKDLEGVALVIQLLLIDAHGKLKTTTISTDVQIRLFERDEGGTLQHTLMQTCQINRRQFLAEPATGGLIPEGDDAPAYLPVAGNGYTFAAPLSDRPKLPVVVKLRTRCVFCHIDHDLKFLMSFGAQEPPGPSTPHVQQLNTSANEAASYVIEQKEKRADFQALRKYFEEGKAARPQ